MTIKLFDLAGERGRGHRSRNFDAARKGNSKASSVFPKLQSRPLLPMRWPSSD
jgi:hypothetical protein